MLSKMPWWEIAQAIGALGYMIVHLLKGGSP